MEIICNSLLCCSVSWADPVTVHFSSLNAFLFTTPLPTGGAVLANILHTMDGFGLKKADAKDALTYHRFVEASKFGFAERMKLGDWPDDPADREIMERVRCLL